MTEDYKEKNNKDFINNLNDEIKKQGANSPKMMKRT